MAGEGVRVRPWLRRLVRIVLPLLLLIAAWQIWDNVEARRIQPLIARVRAASERGPRPVTDPPGVDNAGRYYAAAAMVVEQNPRGGFEAKYGHITRALRAELDGGPPAPAWMSTELARAIDYNRTVIELIERGAPLEFYGFAWSRREVPRSPGLGDAGRVAAARTVERLHAGDPAAAARSLVARILYLRAYDDGTGAYQKTYDLRFIVNDLGVLLGRGGIAAGDRAALDAALATTYEREQAERVVASMAAGMYPYLESMWNGRSWQFGPPGVLMRPLVRHATVAYLRTAADAIDAASLPWPARMRALDTLPEHRPALPWTPVPGLRVTGSLFGSRVHLFAEGVVLARAARLAIAVDDHRGRVGTLPGSLADVSGQPAGDRLDVYTGGDLRYVSTPEGFVVYSVGRDRADDKGAVVPAPKNGEAPGIASSLDFGVRVNYRRAASTSPSNSGRNSPVR